MFDHKKATQQLSNELHKLMEELEEDIEILGGDRIIKELDDLNV